MADNAGNDALTENMNSLQLNGGDHADENVKETDKYLNEWGFPQQEVYRFALKFYKDKEGSKALSLTYQDKLRMVALTKQVAHGQYRTDVSPEVGFLDVVGNDRRSLTDPSVWLAWQKLSTLSKEEAMLEFITGLDRLCSLFRPFMQAQKAEKEERERRRSEEEEEEKRRVAEEAERLVQEEEAERRQQEEQAKQAQQESQIRAALNQQTAIQFSQYAEQQLPGSKDQQAALIAQLQEQHYQQYMQQVYQQQLLHQQQQFQQLQAMAQNPGGNPTQPPPPMQPVDTSTSVQYASEVVAAAEDDKNRLLVTNGDVADEEKGDHGNVEDEEGESYDDEDSNPNGGETMTPMPPLVPASIWTRKDVRVFKDSIRKNPDNIIKIGSLATATVRVPTHEDGTCLFWEFATDSYDIGFGVYFEWTISPSNQVSVHVSESSDEEELDEEAEAARTGEKGDIEKGSSDKNTNQPPTDEIIPVYRRDCHEEVYCGSHMYPGRGVYLLKFDNSYSLWRSKTLYYRVYYTR